MKRFLLSTLAAVSAIVTLSLAASCTKTEADPEAPENSEENSYLFRYTAYEETVPDEWAGYRHGFDAATGEGWIELSSDVTEIPEDAFRGTGLTSIEIPASVTEIKEEAFEYCEDLTSVTFAEGSQLKIIGKEAFWGSGLTSIEIPASVIGIMESAFEYCGNLGSVTFAEGSQLITIGECVFFRTSGLTTITIPESVRHIGMFAFCGNYNLKTVVFLSSAPPYHGDYIFEYCDSLEAICVPDGSEDAYKWSWPEYAQIIRGENQ